MGKLTKFELMKLKLEVKGMYMPTMNRTKFHELLREWVRDSKECDTMKGETITEYAQRKGYSFNIMPNGKPF